MISSNIPLIITDTQIAPIITFPVHRCFFSALLLIQVIIYYQYSYHKSEPKWKNNHYPF